MLATAAVSLALLFTGAATKVHGMTVPSSCHANLYHDGRNVDGLARLRPPRIWLRIHVCRWALGHPNPSYEAAGLFVFAHELGHLKVGVCEPCSSRWGARNWKRVGRALGKSEAQLRRLDPYL